MLPIAAASSLLGPMLAMIHVNVRSGRDRLECGQIGRPPQAPPEVWAGRNATFFTVRKEGTAFATLCDMAKPG
jgi:hypothetical protein